MASEFQSDKIFDLISQEIMDAFKCLIEQLITRRDELLEEVTARKQYYISTLLVEDENVRELTNIQSQIEQLSIRQNIPSSKIQESLVPLQKQIRDVIQPPNLKFECSHKEMSDQIRKLGSVVLNKTPLSAHYECKKKAEIILKCPSPTYIHVDETYLYAIGGVYNRYTSGIVKTLDIFKVQDWSPAKKIPNENAMKPIVVTTNNEHLYIVYKDVSLYQDEDDTFGTMVDENTFTNEDHIYKFNKANRKKLKSINLSKCKNYYRRDVIGIAMSPTDEIYVLFSHGNEIGIFDANLFYRRQIEMSLNPTCIQFKEDRLYLMVRSNIFHYSNRQFIELGFRKHLKSFDGDKFCFDSIGNIIISDKREVKVVSPDGEKMFEIGPTSQCNEDVRDCSALTVFDGKIIVACSDLDSIKIF